MRDRERKKERTRARTSVQAAGLTVRHADRHAKKGESRSVNH